MRWVVVGIGAVVVVALGVFFLVKRVKAVAEATEQALVGEVAPGDVLLSERMARSFGVQSLGVAQVRGNGVLALTRADLRFQMLVPTRRLDIPLERIVAVETARSHLGKSVGRELLRVRFTNEEGAEDAIAWFVARGPEAWIAAIEGARG